MPYLLFFEFAPVALFATCIRRLEAWAVDYLAKHHCLRNTVVIGRLLSVDFISQIVGNEAYATEICATFVVDLAQGAYDFFVVFLIAKVRVFVAVLDVFGVLCLVVKVAAIVFLRKALLQFFLPTALFVATRLLRCLLCATLFVLLHALLFLALFGNLNKDAYENQYDDSCQKQAEKDS